jgi:pantoate--beta-alanine ligase
VLEFERIADLRGRIREWRADGQRVALVPTLGNLHGGHQSLMETARGLCERVVVSIFVNPTQFGLGEDYQNYPRTMEADQARLREVAVDALFAPPVNEMYPNGYANSTHVEVPVLSRILCGANRPGHFRGVATVVCKLFNMAVPDVGVFGEKDWQQLRVIRHMVSDLALPIEIYGAPTVREADGLAVSSRNAYLTPREREISPLLHQIMVESAAQIRRGSQLLARIEEDALNSLTDAGFRPDYFTIRRGADLGEPDPSDSHESLRIFAAAWLGGARLIDNIPVHP